MGRLRKAPAVIASLATEKVAGRSNLILLLILLSIVVATPVSAEEIKLTTIIPDQTILRTKKGAIGDNYSNPDPLTGGISNNSIPQSGLIVEGNVGIKTGTTPLTANLTVSGNMVLVPLNQAPLSPQEGMIYYDMDDHIMRYWSGSGGWVPMGGGGVGAFGLTTQLEIDITTKANTDGFVWAYTDGINALEGWTSYPSGSGSSGSLQLIAKSRNNADPFLYPHTSFIMFPVRKNDYWKVTKPGGAYCYVWWMPVGS